MRSAEGRPSRRLYAIATLVVIMVVDVALANLPGPVPSTEAVESVEHDPAFLRLVNSSVILGFRVNGSYSYLGYSNNPSRDFRCVPGPFLTWYFYFDPFHQYTTTTLVFEVSFQGTHGLPNGTMPDELFNLFITANPTTGQILSIAKSPFCV